MIAPWSLLLLGALMFTGQDLPGVDVIGVEPIGGIPEVNYRQADLNEDGRVDLVLPDAVFLQKGDGQFDVEGRLTIPDANQGGIGDISGKALYLRVADKLRVMELPGGAWQTSLEQMLPGSSYKTSAPDEARSGIRFERFLHDFTGDGVPELVLPGVDGLIVYAREGDAYAQAAELAVLPVEEACVPLSVSLWPPAQRRVSFPRLEAHGTYSLTGCQLTVITWRDLPGQQIQYQMTVYTVDPAQGYQVNADATVQTKYEPVPVCVRPCRLNQDALLDLAGGDWTLSNVSALPSPIYTTMASVDGGQEMITRRSRWFSPHQSFVDFDGDGDLDLVTEGTGLFDGGVRESVNRFMTGRAITHTVSVFLQDARGKFSDRADVTTSVEIQLDRPPFRGTSWFERYLASEFVDLSGDFNKDGYRDLLVRNAPDQVGIFLSSGRSFSPDATVQLTVQETMRAAVSDVNRDGLSDVVASPLLSDLPDGVKSHVFFAREAP